MLQPITRPLLNPIMRGVTEAGVGGAVASSLYRLRAKIEAGTQDAAILMTGDSTGDQTSEWPYLFGQWLSAQYPTHTVEYRLFDFPSNAYGAVSTISTGSGARKITIHNAHVGSTQPMSIAGDRFAASIAAVSPDLMIVNSGHNMNGGTAYSYDNAYVSLVEMMLLAHPSAPVGLMLQNPNRDSTANDQKIEIQRAYASLRGDIEVYDAWSKFVAAGKASNLYNDALHPSPSGQALMRDAITDRWPLATSANEAAPPAWLSVVGTNLLTNGDFSAFGGAVPDGWTQTGTGSASKDTIIIDGASAYSVKLDTPGPSTSSRLLQTISGAALDAVKGKKLTLAVRQRRITGALASIGRVELRKFGGAQEAALSFDHSSTYAGGCNNGWFWNIVRGFTVGTDATSLQVSIYTNPGNNEATTVWVDRAILVVGDIPNDCTNGK